MEDVLLFSLTPLPRPRQIIMIGVLRGVRQLLDNEKIQIWNVMQQHNYIENVVNPAFQVIEGFALDEQASGTGVFVENNFGANIGHLPLIQGNAPNGFFVNFQYQKIEIFPKDRWINLTEIDPVVNKAWRRITNLYYVNKRPLIEAKLETIGLI